MSKRIVLVGLIVGLTLFGAGLAQAKGAAGATITGPGLDSPIELTGTGEPGQGTDLSRLVEQSGFFDLVYVMEGPSKVTKSVPVNPEGPVYEIVWRMEGAKISSQIYPFVQGGPLVHLESGQEIQSDGMTTNGGWFRAAPALLDTLEEIGVPLVRTVQTPPPPEGAQLPATIEGPNPTVESGIDQAAARAVTTAPSTSTRSGVMVVTVVALALALAGGIWATGRRPRRLRAP